MPLESWTVQADTEQIVNWPVIQEIVLRSLQAELTQKFTVSLVDRRSGPQTELNKRNENLTCLITTSRDLNSDTWLHALFAIENAFDRNNITGLSVEILDPDVYHYYDPECHFALDPKEPIVALWPRILPDILPLLDDLPRTTLSVVRRGVLPNRFDNMTVVLVGAPESTRSKWGSIHSQIKSILNKFNLHEVVVHNIPISEPFFASGVDNPEEITLLTTEFEQKVKMGATFGPKIVEKSSISETGSQVVKKISTSATVGGTIQLRNMSGGTLDLLMSVFHPFRTRLFQKVCLKFQP